MNSAAHIFALYTAGTSLPMHPGAHVVRDKALAHRMQRVLRFKVGQSLQLFDDHAVAEAIFLGGVGSDGVHITISSIHKLQALQPFLCVMLPLLKREALHDAVYTCVEMGANTIQLVCTEKTQKKWTGEHELERLRAVMIAAAEQSKQFVLPQLYAPCSLATVLGERIKAAEMRLYLDPQGKSLTTIGSILTQEHPKIIALTFGPEGDFTAQEKTLLVSAGFQSWALTPTVLRAQQALAVSLGFLRSITT